MALGKELLEQGHQLVMVARRMAEELELFTHTPNATIVFCDMCDYGRVADLVTGEIDTAVLLAWNGTRGEARNDRELQERNIQYNRAILDQLLRLGCRKIITA
ncbi:NAD-dependent epimerase/dehydratase family protein, partial [Anaerostipes hadrus]|uniref:NAD-dependent epimerase/dehydratase family protein n=1 Tax=Anaerostipes hadrus TaxID=649756 RepID=UPI001FA7144A